MFIFGGFSEAEFEISASFNLQFVGISIKIDLSVA